MGFFKKLRKKAKRKAKKKVRAAKAKIVAKKDEKILAMCERLTRPKSTTKRKTSRRK